MALTADTLIQEIETMTVLELANLVKALEERFGVSAAAVAAPAGGAAARRRRRRADRVQRRTRSKPAPTS